MPKKKTIMRAFKINEISAVDVPAQEGARMLLMKRNGSLIDEPLEKGAVLLSSVDGHAHLIYCLDDSGGTTSYSKSPKDVNENDPGHSHPYVITADGKILIGEAEGHTHKIEAFGKSMPMRKEDDKNFLASDYAYVPDVFKSDTWKLRLTDTPGGEPSARVIDETLSSLTKVFEDKSFILKAKTEVIKNLTRAWLGANTDKTNDDLPEILKSNSKENDMTLEEMKKAHDAVIAKKDAEIAKANQLASMSDVEKAHYESLDAAGKDAYIAKSADERKAIVKNLADANPVIYKSASGAEFRKNDDPRLIDMAKQADENAKVAKAATEALANEQLQKRAVEVFKNSPGTVEEKGAMLKALEAIPDEALRKKAIESATAGDRALAAAFTRKGANGETVSNEAGDAHAKLTEMAKSYADTNKVSFHKAYDVVTQTADGKKLYEQTLN